jgi:hypothetical protein
VASESLYRRILGDQLDKLPSPMRHFHDAANGSTAKGIFNITRGPGWFRNFLASMMSLPPSGSDVPLELSVTPVGPREHWVRRFGNHSLKTQQWKAGTLLIEAGGPMRLGFELVTNETSIQFKLIRAWFCLIPLPRFLALRLQATETACEGGWDVVVQFSLPLLGTLIRYEGRVLVE